MAVANADLDANRHSYADSDGYSDSNANIATDSHANRYANFLANLRAYGDTQPNGDISANLSNELGRFSSTIRSNHGAKVESGAYSGSRAPVSDSPNAEGTSCILPAACVWAEFTAAL